MLQHLGYFSAQQQSEVLLLFVGFVQDRIVVIERVELLRQSVCVVAQYGGTELFACLLTVLLPIKFASFVSAPEGGALYWSDPLSLVFIAWPLPVFMMASPVLLGLTVLAALFRKEMTFRPPLLKYSALWLVLGGVSILGLADASCMGYPPQMIAHTLSLAAYATSLSLLQMCSIRGIRDTAPSI